MDFFKSDKARQTKRKIVEAAEVLLMERDITKVSVSEIVKKAKVAKGTFYLYFESKEDLAWDLVQKGVLIFWHEITELKEASVSKETIDNLISKAINFSIKNKKIIRIIHQVKFLEFINHENHQSKFEEKFSLAIKAWLDRGIAEGVLDIQDSDFYAKFILISLHEILERMILGELDYDLNEAETHLKDIINKIIGW
ncbi:hypothetical protein BKP45_13700 [Anaerobacillus alkalidiazotrophicus]|uniref:HTH tetR-type domain-containing protein n=1 Tax=Anaerobacillus alkalidiazotrophicus TaxID=472963 RepID=A0A1S2M380_9BACI|nr:TetR/AcrR family transcriptional regulator [Anaerobacillus alkalidiazotrophicus]OIJ19209.1 hypothetical protein BKP45_13700 [Anaerobacillus alkalidiazotrophicus]